jgi:hypothetical protein
MTEFKLRLTELPEEETRRRILVNVWKSESLGKNGEEATYWLSVNGLNEKAGRGKKGLDYIREFVRTQDDERFFFAMRNGHPSQRTDGIGPVPFSGGLADFLLPNEFSSIYGASYFPYPTKKAA